LAVLIGDSPDKQAEAAIEHFRDEDNRQEFYQFFKELQDLYEIISPDPSFEGISRLQRCWVICMAVESRIRSTNRLSMIGSQD